VQWMVEPFVTVLYFYKLANIYLKLEKNFIKIVSLLTTVKRLLHDISFQNYWWPFLGGILLYTGFFYCFEFWRAWVVSGSLFSGSGLVQPAPPPLR
jgi:hypothetical protein